MAAKDSRSAGKSGLTPKQAAAQARAEAEAAERRRENTIRIVGGLVVLLIVAGLVGVGLWAGRDSSVSTAGSSAPTPDANAALPAGVSSDTYGVPYGAGWAADNEAKLPTLELWEDFQCPACGQVEALSGEDIKALADDGLVKLLFRPATFLDDILISANETNGNPYSSARATGAWGCAVDAGFTGEYHGAVFASQPAEEGVGFSDEQLTEVASEVGIEGEALDAFTACLDNGTYLSWAANSNEEFTQAQVGGTPAGYLNGVQLDGSELADVEGLAAKIAAATAP